MRLYFVVLLWSCFMFLKGTVCDNKDVIKIASTENFIMNPKNFVTIGDRDYYIQSSDIQTSAKIASQICNSFGMALASFETFEENLRVKNYLRDNGISSPIWSSGLVYGDEKIWSGSGHLMEFTDWYSDLYYNYDLCVYLEASKGWSSASCADFHFFICEEKYI